MARTNSLSRPVEAPSVATAKPISVNEVTSPAPNASGPKRLRCAALPSTIGTSGRTHGDRIVSAPAAKDSSGLRPEAKTNAPSTAAGW